MSLCSSELLSGVEERNVFLVMNPEMVHDHGELSGDGDHGAFLRVLSAPAGDRLAVPTQVGIDLRAERSEDVLRGVHQEPTTESISFLGDPSLLVFFSRIVTPWHQPEVGAGTA